MTISKLVLHADVSESFQSRAQVACELAANSGAKMTVLHSHPELAALTAEVAAPGQMWSHYKELLWGAEAKCKQVLDDVMGGRENETTWQHSQSDVLAALEREARFADCVVLSQVKGRADEKNPILDPGKVIDVVGRPCLIVPHTVRTDWIPARVAVAWNDSVESAKAVRESVQWLTAASEVVICIVDAHDQKQDIDVEAVSVFLAERDIDFSIVRIGAMEAVDEAWCFQQWAQSESIDLLIQGAYGHRRGYELVFGGFTQSTLRYTKLPVLMVA